MAVLFRKPGFLLARVDQIATALLAARTARVTPAQAEMLLLVERLGPLPQIALARAGGVDKSTTGLVLDNLEARDLVVRSPCPEDRRRAQVSLGAAAPAMLGEVRDAFDAVQRDLLLPLDVAAGPRFTALLHRIGANPLSPASPWKPAGVVEDAPSFLCRRVLQHLQAAFAAADPGLQTTLRQFSLLYILSRREWLSQMGFARLFGLDPSTCAVIVRSLVKRGLLSGQPSPRDGRERLYRLTAEGVAALARAQDAADRSARAAFRGESTADVRWLIGCLRRIVGAHSARLRFPGVLPDDLHG